MRWAGFGALGQGVWVSPRVEAEATSADEVDPDIRAVFLEEAREVQETIEAAFARWRRNPDDSEAMLEVRRGFHTLKGSGRMVEATDLGEFAWASERLLNACRDGEIVVSPDIVQTVGEAIDYLRAEEWLPDQFYHVILIDPRRHRVLKAPHPSPLSAHAGFFGSRPFSRANAWLTARGAAPIDWDLTR